MILECCCCRLGKLTFLSAKSTMSEIKSKKSFYATLLGTTCLACLGTSSPALAEIIISGGSGRIGLVTTEGGTGTKIVSSSGPVSLLISPGGDTGLAIDPKIANCESLSDVECVVALIAASEITNYISKRTDGGIVSSGVGNLINVEPVATISTGATNAAGISSTSAPSV